MCSTFIQYNFKYTHMRIHILFAWSYHTSLLYGDMNRSEIRSIPLVQQRYFDINVTFMQRML